MRNGNRSGKHKASASPSRRDGLKIIGYGGLAAWAAIVGTNGMAFAEQAAAQRGAGSSAIDAPALFDMLPDWSLANGENPMSMSDLVNLKDASIALLKRVESGETAAFESELKQYIESRCQPGGIFDIDKASGLFLLLRIIFDVPDLVPAQEGQTFGGWHAAEDEHALKQKRESDDLHPSWPIYIARISNKLYVKSNNPPSIGEKPAYKIWDEYQYMKGRYKFRTSSYISGLEFIFVADK